MTGGAQEYSCPRAQGTLATPLHAIGVQKYFLPQGAGYPSYVTMYTQSDILLVNELNTRIWSHNSVDFLLGAVARFVLKASDKFPSHDNSSNIDRAIVYRKTTQLNRGDAVTKLVHAC